jgi:hypothetical protein
MHSRPTSSPSSRSTRRFSIALAALGAVACTGLAIGLTLSAADSRSGTVRSPLDDQFIVSLLPRLSLEARALAAAGVSAEGASALSLRLRAFATVRDLKSELDTLTRTANQSASGATSGATSTTDPNAPSGDGPTIEQQRQAARDAIATLLDEAWTDATSALPEAQRELLRAIRSNAQSDLPTEYRVALRTPAATIALRAALAEQRFAASRGKSASAEATALISAADADANVAQARASLAENLSAIEQSLRPTANGSPTQP